MTPLWGCSMVQHPRVTRAHRTKASDWHLTSYLKETSQWLDVKKLRRWRVLPTEAGQGPQLPRGLTSARCAPGPGAPLQQALRQARPGEDTWPQEPGRPESQQPGLPDPLRQLPGSATRAQATTREPATKVWGTPVSSALPDSFVCNKDIK